ncbi:MAG TPA: hypothetical protein DCY00_07470 [Actinobacteria bacterium]|nr:hypothetical protein [Actinomycetota bacterium]
MKRYLNLKILILILTISYSSFVQAYEEGPGFYAEYGKDIYSNVTYTDIEIHYTLKFWQLELQPYGATETWFISGENLISGGKPFLDIYSWGARIIYNNISFEYEHFCAHPVMSDYLIERKEKATVYTINNNNGLLGDNSDRFSIRYQFN